MDSNYSLLWTPVDAAQFRRLGTNKIATCPMCREASPATKVGSRFERPSFLLKLLIVVAMLGGCDSKPTPEQIAVIERVEVAKAAYSRELQPLLDSMARCMEVKDPGFCGSQFAATPKPSSAQYDLALRICLEKGVPNEYCTGKRRYK
jgi:hypothetical protein